MLVSQEELVNLADQSVQKEEYDQAIGYLEQALNLGPDGLIYFRLAKIYYLTENEDLAYLMIKEVPDLFSTRDIFVQYQLILQSKNYFIEQQKLVKLINANFVGEHKTMFADITELIKAEPANKDVQQKIMQSFLQANQATITIADFQKLYCLDLSNFQKVAENVFLNSFASQNIRLSLIFELIQLEVATEIPIKVLDELKTFVPNQTHPFFESKVLVDGQKFIIDKFSKDPIQAEQFTNEFSFCLQKLYPFEEKMILDVNGFVDALESYLTQGTTAVKALSENSASMNLIARIYEDNERN